MVARKRHASKFVILVVLLVAVTAMADEAVLCGTIMAHADGPDAPGAWRYELRVSWDNEPASALTHFNVKLDDGENCTYEDIRSYLIWDSPAGEGRSAGSSAMLYFDAVLEMDGDPGLLIDVPLLRYAPNDMSQSRPGPQGVASSTSGPTCPPGRSTHPTCCSASASDATTSSANSRASSRRCLAIRSLRRS